MKKHIILSIIGLFALCFAAYANPVDKQNAEKIGKKFLKTTTLHLVKTYHLQNGDAAFYVFNKASGFVIVSADDCAMPILAYSNEGVFDEDDIPVQMQDYLDRFVAQIQYGIDNHIVANEYTARQWENVRATGCLGEEKSTTVVEPLLTSRWNQNYPYNRFCPTAYGGPGNHAYAGCVAVAMGQIMRYWGYPDTGQGSHGVVNFGNTTYQWNQMLDAIPNDPDISEIRPIATLLWHCGVAVDMQYSASGSGADVADVPNALVTYFKYSNNMQHDYKECQGDVYYTDSQWIEKIKNCLDIGRPILYGAADDNIGMGHAFVCDGYDGNDMLHFNWGWSGAGNAYYSLGALNVTSGTGYNYYFNTCNSAIFNIHPANTPEIYNITITANLPEGGMITGAGSYLEGQTCTLAATANEGYAFVNWTENNEVVSTEATYSFIVSGDRNLVANFNETIITHDYVDLGLPSGTLWATCNIGANSPEEYGDYFAWGETQSKPNYSWSTYQYCNGSENTLTKYCYNSNYGYNGFVDNLTVLRQEDDAATVNWGNDWRMPTKEEWQELYQNTTNSWTTQNGVNGWLYTANNGKSIFLPASGYYSENYYLLAESWGMYWSSSLYIDNTNDYPFYSECVSFCSNQYPMDATLRSSGCSVRAVQSVSSNNTQFGAINGVFSVDNNTKVCFSKGNLQFQASTNTWKFAENQWDYVGEGNTNISSYYSGWIDLFGWGTSGYNHGAVCYQPWSVSIYNNQYYAYGNANYNLNDQSGQADWGYNAISNGGNTTNIWRTLTTEEWDYLFNTRNTVSGIRFVKAKVNEINGVILLPDNWINATYNNLNNVNQGDSSYDNNIITQSVWTDTFEAKGAVFLPAAGYRYSDSHLVQVSTGGYYWSSTHEGNYGACGLSFVDGLLNAANNNIERLDGRSVRLVCPAPATVTQTTSLTTGWNWFSTFIAITDPEEGLLMIEEALGNKGVQIKSIDDFTGFDGDGWFGDLNEATNDKMYMIQVSEDCTITLQGLPVNTEEVEITLKPGWNWIGFPYSEAVSVVDAFAGFEPAENDQIKSLDDYTSYDGDEWFGELEELTPGIGFMYYNNSPETKYLIYRTSSKIR